MQPLKPGKDICAMLGSQNIKYYYNIDIFSSRMPNLF